MMLRQADYFSPINLPGLILWLDANDPAANGTQPSNGSSLASWIDKSRSANSVSQGTGAIQPIFNTNIQNGKPAISFNGSQYIDGVFASLATNPNLSICIVFQSGLTINNPILFGFGSSNNSYESLGVGQNTGIYNNFVWAGYESKYSGISTNTHFLSSTVTASTNISHIWIDSNAESSNSGTASTLNVNTNFRVGWMRRADGLFVAKWFGFIMDIVVCNVVWTTEQRLLIQNYVKNKWGL